MGWRRPHHRSALATLVRPMATLQPSGTWDGRQPSGEAAAASGPTSPGSPNFRPQRIQGVVGSTGDNSVTKAEYYEGGPQDLRSKVTIVRTAAEAEAAVAALYAASARGAVHSCDTEVCAEPSNAGGRTTAPVKPRSK